MHAVVGLCVEKRVGDGDEYICSQGGSSNRDSLPQKKQKKTIRAKHKGMQVQAKWWWVGVGRWVRAWSTLEASLDCVGGGLVMGRVRAAASLCGLVDPRSLPPVSGAAGHDRASLRGSVWLTESAQSVWDSCHFAVTHLCPGPVAYTSTHDGHTNHRLLQRPAGTYPNQPIQPHTHTRAWPWSEGRRRCRDTAISRLAAGVMWKYTQRPDEALTLNALIEPRRHLTHHARTHAQTHTHLGRSVDALKSCLASAPAAVAPVERSGLRGGWVLRLVNHCSWVVVFSCITRVVRERVPIIHQLLASAGAGTPTNRTGAARGSSARRPNERFQSIPRTPGPVHEAPGTK